MKGNDFTTAYFVRDGNKQAFLKVERLLTSSRYKGENERNMFKPGAKNHVIDLDGTPAIVTRIRFMNAITSAADNEPRVFCLLNQVLTEDAIHELFPEVWLQWHNFTARHIANREMQERRKLHIDPVHREIMGLTRNGNARKFLSDGNDSKKYRR